jgi:hypothetical protein
LEQTVGQTQFVHHLQDGRVKGIASKITVKVQVRFEQDDGDPLASEHEREDSSCWSCADDTAGRLLS